MGLSLPIKTRAPRMMKSAEVYFTIINLQAENVYQQVAYHYFYHDEDRVEF